MQAAILAGGLGTRLRPLTLTRPKPLLPIVERPMLEVLLDQLPDQVDEAVIAAGYRVEQIEAWAGALDHRVNVTVVAEEEPLGTAGALANVSDHLSGDFLVLNGDVMSAAPLDELIAAREKADARAAISLRRVDDPSAFGVVAMDGERIVRFVEKPRPGEEPSNLINAGAYALSADVLDELPDGKGSLERDVFPRLLAAKDVFVGVPFDGAWNDCGTLENYLAAHAERLDEDAYIAPDATVDGTLEGWAAIGRGATIEKGASLSETVVFDGAVVAADAVLRRCVIGSRARIGRGAHLADCIVADEADVAEHAELVDERIGGD